MNAFVADPHWGWWIVWYFYLGGIAAGAYFVATLVEFVGDEQDRQMGRVGYFLAAPLVAVCGVLLILDLDQPSRFWHMLLDAETLLPHVKHWSPMSIGAWALLLFGAVSTVSFLGALAESGWCGLGRWSGIAARLHRGLLGRAFDLVGTACGFFIAAYTGALLTATNQPVWSDSPWIAALFLASAATSGIAVMDLAATCSIGVSPASRSKIERADGWALGLELAVIFLFLGSLGESLVDFVRQAPGRWLVVGTLGCGVLVPLVLRVWPRPVGRRLSLIAAVLVLVGGFILRYSMLAAAPAMLKSPAAAGARSEMNE